MTASRRARPGRPRTGASPPLQLLRLKRAIGATLEARAKAADRAAILPGDMHVLFDGGKEGNHSKMKAAFVDDLGSALKPKVSRTLQLVFSEDTVAERRGYSTRGARAALASRRPSPSRRRGSANTSWARTAGTLWWACRRHVLACGQEA